MYFDGANKEIFSVRDEVIWSLPDKMNIKKMTHNKENEHAKERKKNLSVTFINFSLSFSLKAYIIM